MSVPEKPALEGLEDEWTARWEADGTYRFDRTRAARRGLLDRHAAADGERLAARRPRLLLHPHRHHRALPAHARQGGVLSDGVGRQRPADRAPRAELLRRALRSVAAVRPVVRAAREAGEAADLGVAAELHRAVHQADGRGREGVRAPVAISRPVGRLVDDLRDHRPAGAARVADHVPAPARSGAGLSARSADAVGRGLPHRGGAGGARRSRAARRLSPRSSSRKPDGGRRRRDRDHAAGAAAGVRGARRASGRRALQAALRHRGR